CKKLEEESKNAEEQMEVLQTAIAGLDTQIKDRQDNQGAWDDFIRIGNLLPDEMRAEPAQAKAWIDQSLNAIKREIAARNERVGELRDAWSNYNDVMDQYTLVGIEGVRDRQTMLVTQRDKIKEDRSRTGKALEAAHAGLRTAQKAIVPLTTKLADAIKLLEKFDKNKAGFEQFKKIFGDIDPKDTNPVADLEKATQELEKARHALKRNADEAGELRSVQSQASTFKSIFGVDADPLQCDPIKDQRLWTERESASRQSMAALNDKKEAIDEFEETHPHVLPGEWLANTDQERERLVEEIEKEEIHGRELNKEIKAIEEMRSVEDGAFEQAWIILSTEGVKAQRLHETILAADFSLEMRTDAMSALSGMLSAPVFDSAAEMSIAANKLQALGIAVPLLLKDALLQAITNGISRHGDVRLFDFIGGNFSRRVRILLDADYAHAELKRLTEERNLCEMQYKRMADRLPALLTTHATYQLACRAKDALLMRAREHYVGHEKEALAAGKELMTIGPRVTLQALDVLRCAKEFIQRGGVERLL
ncbi:MAG TPA: hypothetical protein VIE65_13255, partial [Methylobacter sp.]